MAETMRRRKDDLLTKVEKRKLPWGAPDDANDTSKARAIPQADNPPVNASVEELYSALRDYEAEIQQNHLAVNAAKQSLSKGQSFPEVYSSLKAGVSRMPGFDELIKMQLRGNEWMTSASRQRQMCIRDRSRVVEDWVVVEMALVVVWEVVEKFLLQEVAQVRSVPIPVRN